MPAPLQAGRPSAAAGFTAGSSARGPAPGRIPTARNVDHFAFTVPDLSQAVTFFTEVLGAEVAYRLGPVAAPAGDPDWMRRHLDVDPSASTLIAMLRLGPVSNVELFEYTAPGQATAPPRNCDPGGHHLGFAVADLDGAVAYLRRRPGVTVLDSPRPSPSSQSVQGRWVYFRGPWGMYFSLYETSPSPVREQVAGRESAAERFGAASRWNNTAQPYGSAGKEPATGMARPGGIPTARHVDHVGYTVEDLDAATEFFVATLGARIVHGPGLMDVAAQQYDVPGGAALRQALLRLGPTANVELSEYRVSDGRQRRPRNSDVGGHHLAFWVDDVDAAVDYLAGCDGVRVLGEPVRVAKGPLAGGTWVYFTTPFGMTMEVLNFPDGSLPYEAETLVRRRAHELGPWPI